MENDSKQVAQQLTQRKRLLWLDSLKGFLILLVVLGHAVQLLNTDYQHDILFRYIYSFHMPLFIYVSGYACFRRNVEWSMVKKRFIQLMIPYIIWSFVVCLINGHIRIWEMFLYPERSLWFLYVLFFVTIIHVACVKYSSRLRWKEEIIVALFAIIVFGSMILTQLFGWPIIAKYFMFYSLGFYSRKYISFEKTSQLLALFLITIFFVLAYFCMQDTAPSFMPEGSSMFYKYPYNTFVALVGIAAFMSLFVVYSRNRITPLSKLGGGVTLGVYCIHKTTGMYLVGLFIKQCGYSEYIVSSDFYYLYVMLSFVIMTAISLALIWIFDKNNICRLLFLGKR